MDIAISRGTFARKIGNDALFSNPRSGANMVINEGGVLHDVLSRQFTPENRILAEMASLYGVPFEVVKNDFTDIINDMIEEGLVSSCAMEQKEEVLKKSRVTCANKDVGSFKDDPVGIFYRGHGMPLALHIDVTSNCTERCVHCYLPDYAARYLSFDYIEKTLVDFRELQGLTVYISGGECMTHPDFDRILKKCRELDLNIVILSNLTLCNDEKVKFLQSIEPQYVNVSLYSMDSKEHDAITTMHGSWEKTMAAILTLEKAGIAVRIASPLLRINRKAFPGLKDFADQHNIHLIPDFGIIARSNHDVSNLRYACSAVELEETLRTNKQLFDMGWSRVCRDDINATLCDIGVFRIHLNSNGDYYPCPSMYGYVLGNVKNTSLKDVWFGEKLQYLRAIRLKDLKQCAACLHKNFCEPCLAYNFNATGDMFKTIPERCQTAAIVHNVYGERV